MARLVTTHRSHVRPNRDAPTWGVDGPKNFRHAGWLQRFLQYRVDTASADEQLCGVEDAQALVNSGPIGAVHALSGRDTDRADSWGRCQFRLDDPTHTFSTREWMVGGVFMFETYDALNRPEYDRQAATQFLDQIKVRVWLGPKGGNVWPPYCLLEPVTGT